MTDGRSERMLHLQVNASASEYVCMYPLGDMNEVLFCTVLFYFTYFGCR